MRKIIFSSVLFILFFAFTVHAEMITLRPNATMADAGLKGCSSGWDCLDEVTPDDSTTMVFLQSTANQTMYDLNDTKDYISGGLPSGSRINWVMFTIRTRDNGTAGANNIAIKVNVSNSANNQRSVYNTSTINPGASWVNFNSTNYTTNPKSGAAWTLDEVDGLQIGFNSSDVNPVPNVTQAFVLVGYTPVLTANASFDSRGALATVQANSSTQLGTISNSNIIFNGTCNINGGTGTTTYLYMQDNSSGSFANTSGSPGALVSANRTVYNLSSVSGTSGNMFFNVTVTNVTRVYGLRIQCNDANAVPAAANTTAQTNLTVLFPLEANASFVDSGPTSSIRANQSVLFNGTCIIKGADGTSRNIYGWVQDNSSGSFSNTTGAVGAFIYTNRTVYNVTTTSGTSGNILFNISTLNKTAEYGLRIQCSADNSAPSWQNSTVGTNLSVLKSTLTANASFLSTGAINNTVINSTTDCAASNPQCSHVIINGTCDINGGTANALQLYIQDNSSGSFSNTTGAVGAFIYTNITAYNLTSVSGTSGNMYFNISVTNITAEYGLRIQCANSDIAPSWVNSTLDTNLSVINAPPSDTCTPTADQDWLLNAADNCKLNNVAFSVKKINVTGTGGLFCAKCNITYTVLNMIKTAKFVFNETFSFSRSVG